jgi:four helix bundle protein
LEEADESLYWLELIREGELISESKVYSLLKEADELTAILAAGRKSAASNRSSNIEHLT